jgi:hypothetical protein
VIPAEVSERASVLAERDESPFAVAFRATSAALGVLYGGPTLQRASLKGASK